MADLKVTPEFLRNTARDIRNNMDHAMAIGQAYLSTQQNSMGSDMWSGGGADASNVTAIQVQDDLQKVLNGGTRLCEGLVQAAALIEAHEQDGSHAFQALFGGHGTTAV